jgi:diaminopimelate epimerase
MTHDTFGEYVEFYKMQGCGNDFVAVDNRSAGIPVEAMPELVVKACRRAFGISADGMFFLEEAPAGSGLDYRWHFYNSDGSRAEMCGNASRCAARLAHALGLAPARHVFGTDAGPVEAEVLAGTNRARVRLPAPRDLKLDQPLDVDGQSLTVHFVNTGVPHAVVFVADVEKVDVAGLGRALRFHPHFAPAGTNVNFVQVLSPSDMLLRTYERGVEAETYACGTGAAASQLVANALDLTGDAAGLKTTGGEILGITLQSDAVYLEGAAEMVFTGRYYR